MKVILVTMGTLGDVHPYIGMGVAFKKRGHDVTVLTCEKFETNVSKAGLGFFPINSTENLEKVMARTGIGGKLKYADLKELPRMIAESFDLMLFKTIKPTFEYICREYIPGQTVLISNHSAWGAKFAQEKLGLALISVCFSPISFRSADKPPQFTPFRIPQWLPRGVRGYLLDSLLWFFQERYYHPVNQIRQELGMETISLKGDRWMFSPDKVIGLFTEWFAPPQADWLPQIELAGFPFYDESGDLELSLEITEFLAAGEPPIVFTPGSFVKSETYFHQAAQICRELGKRAIFLSHETYALPKEIASSIRYFGYVPFSKLLPHAAAVVYHGGTGTCGQTCRAGIPHLIIPNLPDQFDTAARIQNLGLGFTLTQHQYFSPRLARKLKTLVESKEIKARCQEIARTFETEDAFSRICHIAEKLTPPQTSIKQ